MALISGRYEIKEIIGEGGMGVVYRAFDFQTQGDVALKTIKELVGQSFLDLFRRECAVLRKLKHPNVIDLYDYGTYEEEGMQKPFFVMPLLPGVTLDKLIRANATRLTPERVVDIITQTAKGLQAAHDLGLVHRDVKPSNIFVLGDDTVKLIDFGVVHQVDQHTRTGFKGTPSYMSPEQLQLTPPTAVSDVFSLAVVCYEALTRRRPFSGNGETDIRETILHTIPPPVSELNHEVSLVLSQVIHAAMAKQPWNRTPTASQFADELQKAFHDQTIERFDPGRIEPRILRAQRALEASQYDFAAEILTELEAEGHIHPDIRSLRRQIDQALRAKSIKQTMESAQHRFAESEYQLALQKVDEVLRLDPANEQATALKNEINSKSREQQIDNWFRLAKDHIQNYAFNHARQALQNVLRLRPTDSMAIKMLSEVDRRGNEYLREHREKEKLYNSALDAWHRGEVSVAMNKLERVMELDRRAPDSASSESGLSYQNLYNEVRSEHDRIKNAYEEARRLLSQNDFTGASEICEQYLGKFPDHPLFQALKFDIGEQQRQHVSAYIVKTDRDIEAEVDLNRKVAILTEAQERHPGEAHFRERLAKITQRRDLVASITQKIRNLEERGQYAEALGQTEILRAIHPKNPGLDLEIDRISKRRDQQAKADEKSQWVDRIDRAISKGDFSHGLNMLKSALADFHDDPELIALERLAQDGQARSQEAARLFENAQAMIAEGDLKSSVESLWQAHRLDEHNALIQAVLVETLLKRASGELDRDPTLSEQLIRQAIELDPENPQAKSLQQMAIDRRKDRAVDLVLLGSRELQASGNVEGALSTIEKGLSTHGQEPRLVARLDALLKLSGTGRRVLEKEKDLAEMRVLQDRIRHSGDATTFATMMEVSRAIAGKHPGDPDVESAFKDLETFVLAQKREPVPSADQPVRESVPPEPITPAEGAIDSISDKDPPVAAVSVKRFPARAMLLIASLVLVVGAIASIVVHFRNRAPAPPPLFQAEVTFSASMPGAHVIVDEKDLGATDQSPQKITLPEGTHSIDAKLPGFLYTGPKTLAISSNDAGPRTVNFNLEPLKPMLRVVTDLQKAFLDSLPLKLDGAGVELDEGHHMLTFSDPVNGTVSMEFDMENGQLPKVTTLPDPRVPVVAVATLENAGHVSANSKLLKAGLNNSEVQEVGEQGLTLNEFKSESANELHLVDNQNPARTELIDWNSHPSLTILIGSPNIGILNVEESQKVDATVSIKSADNVGTPQLKTLTNGKASFRLVPKEYLVTISAAGYDLETRKVTVVKGKIADPFMTTLKRTVTTATLTITGGTPDADIYLDNNRVPIRVSSAGDFTSQVPPGKHTLQLKKPDYEPGSLIERDFVVGSTVTLSAREIVVLIPFGTLTFNVSPGNSDVIYATAGEPAVHVKPGDKVRVRQGSYSITASANGYVSSGTTPFRVEPGRDTIAKIDLKKTDDPKPLTQPAPPPTLISRGVESLKGMKAQDTQTTQCQQDICLFQEKQPGTYRFKIKLSGVFSKGAKWIVGYVDARNFIEYKIDEKNISFTTSQNGNKKESKPVAHSIKETNGFYDVTVTIGSNGIVVSSGGNTIPIPSPPGDATLGTFGFDKNVTIKNDFQFTSGK